MGIGFILHSISQTYIRKRALKFSGYSFAAQFTTPYYREKKKVVLTLVSLSNLWEQRLQYRSWPQMYTMLEEVLFLYDCVTRYLVIQWLTRLSRRHA